MKNVLIGMLVLGSMSAIAGDICVNSIKKTSIKQTVDDSVVAVTESFLGFGFNGKTTEGKPQEFKVTIVPLSLKTYNILNEASAYREKSLCVQGTLSSPYLFHAF